MRFDKNALAFKLGYAVNKNGGLYLPGKSYPVEKKIVILKALIDLSNENPGETPSLRKVASQAGISNKYANKVINEIMAFGEFEHPDDHVPDRKKGVGSIALTFEDESFLLYLRFENPQRNNLSYVTELYRHLGTLV